MKTDIHFYFCRKNHILFPALLGIAFLLFSCSPKIFRVNTLPNNVVINGEMKNGEKLYIARDNDSTILSGEIFTVGCKSYTRPFRYISDFYGNMIIYSGADTLQAKIVSDRKGDDFRVILPKITENSPRKQQIKLKFSHLNPEYKDLKNRYKEYVFDSITSRRDILYGKAQGYYTSRSLDNLSNNDYSSMLSAVLKDFTGNVLKKGLSEQPLLLDIHQPYNDHFDKRPVFLFIHGGAFLFGDKQNRLQISITDELVKRGYVVVSANYRLGCNFAGFKAVERSIYRGVQDARAALRYLTHYSESLRIDPNKIFLGGSSAGAIIALTTAFMDEDEKFEVVSDKKEPLGNLDDSGNILSDSFKIAGTAALWGAVTDLSIIDNNPTIPTLLFHGTADEIVPHVDGLPFKNEMGDFLHNRLSVNWKLYGSESIYHHMKSLNMPVKYIPFEAFGHEPQVALDGSYNNNMSIINDEIQKYLFTNITKDDPHFRIAGDVFVKKSDTIPRYSLPEWSGEVVEWHAVGGFVLSQDNQSATVVWYDEVSQRKLIAHIYDEKGREFKRELVITLY